MTVEPSTTIREARPEDASAVADVETRAFGSDAEARLVADLVADPTAQPCLSLLAFDAEHAVGHILLTRAYVSGHEKDAEAMLLAPLAIVPERQKQGIGEALMREALARLAARRVGLVFALGHPAYYPRVGFRNDAWRLGFQAPYPIAEQNRDAWMVLELVPGLIGGIAGEVRVAETLMKPEYWRE